MRPLRVGWVEPTHAPHVPFLRERVRTLLANLRRRGLTTSGRLSIEAKLEDAVSALRAAERNTLRRAKRA